MSESRDFYFQSQDHKIHCQTIGTLSPGLPALVFLHDALGSNAQWRDFPAAVSQSTGLPALSFERRGHGRSSPYKEKRRLSYLHEEAVLLPAVLENAGVTRPVLIGHSDGGSIALLAKLDPAKPVCIVTIAAHLFIDDVMIQGIQSATELFRNSDLRTKLQKYHGASTDDLFEAWSGLALTPDFRSWNIENEISHVTCPVLVIQGSKDEYTGLAQPKAITQRVSGPSRLEIVPECGHSPHLQARPLVLGLVSEFILSCCKKED